MRRIVEKTEIWFFSTIVAAAFAFSSGQDVALPDGPGKPILQKACTVCHGLDRVTEERLDRGGWQSVIDSMKAEGAEIDKADEPVLLAYLVRNFGPGGPPPAQKKVEKVDFSRSKRTYSRGMEGLWCAKDPDCRWEKLDSSFWQRRSSRFVYINTSQSPTFSFIRFAQ
jgi:hypothetical protein